MTTLYFGEKYRLGAETVLIGSFDMKIHDYLGCVILTKACIIL